MWTLLLSLMVVVVTVMTTIRYASSVELNSTATPHVVADSLYGSFDIDCGISSQYPMTITYYGEAYAVYANGFQETCSFEDLSQLTVVAVWQRSIPKDDLLCGVLKAGMANTWVIRIVVQIAALRRLSDGVYVLTCNYEKSLGNFDNRLEVFGAEEAHDKFAVDMSILDDRGESALHLALGQPIQIQGNLRYDEYNYTMNAVSCRATDGSLNPRVAYRILNNGCGDGVIIPSNEGFTSEGSLTTSPLFTTFLLRGAAAIQFNCDFKACPPGDDSCMGSSCKQNTTGIASSNDGPTTKPTDTKPGKVKRDVRTPQTGSVTLESGARASSYLKSKRTKDDSKYEQNDSKYKADGIIETYTDISQNDEILVPTHADGMTSRLATSGIIHAKSSTYVKNAKANPELTGDVYVINPDDRDERSTLNTTSIQNEEEVRNPASANKLIAFFTQKVGRLPVYALVILVIVSVVMIVFLVVGICACYRYSSGYITQLHKSNKRPRKRLKRQVSQQSEKVHDIEKLLGKTSYHASTPAKKSDMINERYCGSSSMPDEKKLNGNGVCKKEPGFQFWPRFGKSNQLQDGDDVRFEMCGKRNDATASRQQRRRNTETLAIIQEMEDMEDDRRDSVFSRMHQSRIGNRRISRHRDLLNTEGNDNLRKHDTQNNSDSNNNVQIGLAVPGNVDANNNMLVTPKMKNLGRNTIYPPTKTTVLRNYDAGDRRKSAGQFIQQPQPISNHGSGERNRPLLKHDGLNQIEHSGVHSDNYLTNWDNLAYVLHLDDH